MFEISLTSYRTLNEKKREVVSSNFKVSNDQKLKTISINAIVNMITKITGESETNLNNEVNEFVDSDDTFEKEMIFGIYSFLLKK